MKTRVTAIVPAFNEEKHIKGVLIPLINSPYVDEVICVDDGSTDSTLRVAKSIERVNIIHYEKNRGKAYAIVRGIEKAQGHIVLLLDADIRGLKNRNIIDFISPLKSGKYDLAIGYCSSKMESSVGVPISGQRAYLKRDLLSCIDELENKGYGIEIYLNYKFKNKRKKIFKLGGVFSYSKNAKHSNMEALRGYGYTTFQIMQEIVKRKNAPSYFLNAYLMYVYVNDKSLSRYLSYKSFIQYIRE